MVTEEKAVILDFGFAQERARVFRAPRRRPPDGGTPNYMSPERLISRRPEDDVYRSPHALGNVDVAGPEPGSKPRRSR